MSGDYLTAFFRSHVSSMTSMTYALTVFKSAIDYNAMPIPFKYSTLFRFFFYSSQSIKSITFDFGTPHYKLLACCDESSSTPRLFLKYHCHNQLVYMYLYQITLVLMSYTFPHFLSPILFFLSHSLHTKHLIFSNELIFLKVIKSLGQMVWLIVLPSGK